MNEFDHRIVALLNVEQLIYYDRVSHRNLLVHDAFKARGPS